MHNKYKQGTRNFLFNLQACIVLLFSNGFRKTLSIISRYPGVIIIATFSCWTIGPANISKCGDLFGKDDKIGISPVHSWMNFILTTGIGIFSLIDMNMTTRNLNEEYYSCWIFAISNSFFPAICLAILVTMIFLLHGDYISCCIPNCKSNQYTFLNTANMQEEFPIQETSSMNQTSPTNNCCSCCSCCSCTCCRKCLSYFFVVILLADSMLAIFGALALHEFCYEDWDWD